MINIFHARWNGKGREIKVKTYKNNHGIFRIKYDKLVPATRGLNVLTLEGTNLI